MVPHPAQRLTAPSRKGRGAPAAGARSRGDRRRAGLVPSTVPSAPIPVNVFELLEQSRRCLADAERESGPARRFAVAHLAALRAAAAVLGVRGQPGGPVGAGRLRSAWALLAKVAPELAEWAAFFAAGAAKRPAAEAGLANVVTQREADDLLRDAHRFVELCESAIGLLPARSAAGG
jgi:SAV_6107-like HEPN